MCTVVLRREPGRLRALALRDELVGRDFDDPGAWWPGQPTVVGGRDRVAGGSWCVTDVATGTTAFVLNRPQRRLASPGAPSRGVLPLLAVQHGEAWAEHLDTTGMASFALVLATVQASTLWVFDSTSLVRTELADATCMITSGGAEDGKAARHLEAFSETDPDRWVDLLGSPTDDLTALVVRHETDHGVFGTVFAQLLDAGAGNLQVRSTRTPARAGSWTATDWAEPH